jgi:cellulose synthase/poly-beta-1,6-N-acetylglucosamine synthase-like glycosyltransferase
MVEILLIRLRSVPVTLEETERVTKTALIRSLPFSHNLFTVFQFKVFTYFLMVNLYLSGIIYLKIICLYYGEKRSKTTIL